MKRGKFKYWISAICIFFICYSCTEENKETEQSKETTSSDVLMYEPSDLVILMRQMEGNLAHIKTTLDAGNPLEEESLQEFTGIFTEKPSEDVIRDSSYMAIGQQFIDNYEQLFTASDKGSLRHIFNSTIRSCITCHQNRCPGPIKRIKKLVIK